MDSRVRSTLSMLALIGAFIGHFDGELNVQQKLNSLPPTAVTLLRPASQMEFKVHLPTGSYLAWTTAAFACTVSVLWYES